MKNRFGALLLAMGTIVILAGGVAFAQSRSGSYGSRKAQGLERSATTQLSSDGNYSVDAFVSHVPELAEGEGLAETQSFCSTCHSTRYITMQPPLPAASWEAEVNKMTKTYGASIPDATAKKIISYLQAHYTPENRKQ